MFQAGQVVQSACFNCNGFGIIASSADSSCLAVFELLVCFDLIARLRNELRLDNLAANISSPWEMVLQRGNFAASIFLRGA